MSVLPARFTKSFVDRLPFVQPGDPSPQRVYRDSEVKALRLIVGRTAKTFAVDGRVRGKRKLILIARHGDHEGTQPITIDEVRRRALDIKRRLREGEDVPTMGEAKQQREAEAKKAKESEKSTVPERITLRASWAIVRDEMTNAGAAKTTLDDYDLKLRVHLGDWLDRPLAEIGRDRAGVVARHAALSAMRDRQPPRESDSRTSPRNQHRKVKPLPDGSPRRLYHGGKASANGTMRVLRAVYNRIARIYGEDQFPPNPVRAVRFNKVKPRKSAFSEATLQAWYAGVLQLRSPVLRDYFLMLLFTGLRKTSAAQIRWKDVDLTRGTLFIPTPKGGEERAFTLPISEPMREILERRRKGGTCKGALVAEDPGNDFLAPGSEYVFPGRIAEKRTHLQDVRVADDFPVEFTPHALRHTFNSIAIAAGVSDYYIKVLMNHALPTTDMTALYFTPQFEELRSVQEKVTAKILTALGRKR